MVVLATEIETSLPESAVAAIHGVSDMSRQLFVDINQTIALKRASSEMTKYLNHYRTAEEMQGVVIICLQRKQEHNRPNAMGSC